MVICALCKGTPIRGYMAWLLHQAGSMMVCTYHAKSSEAATVARYATIMPSASDGRLDRASVAK